MWPKPTQYYKTIILQLKINLKQFQYIITPYLLGCVEIYLWIKLVQIWNLFQYNQSKERRD